MSDPSLSLQAKIVAALKASGAVSALVAARIHDHAPQNVAYPWIGIGEFQTIDDSTECFDAFEVAADIHVLSRPENGGQVEVKKIAAAVRGALKGAALALDAPFALLEIAHRTTRILRDPDGQTLHAVVSFRALIDG